MDRDRVENPLDRRSANLTLGDRVVGHPLHDLEYVALFALVLVDRHCCEDTRVTTVTSDDAVEGGRGVRIGSVIVGLVIIAAKTFLLRWLLDHGRIGVSVVVGLGALHALRRGRPLRASVSLGIVVAVATAHSFGAGVLIAIGAIATLIALSFVTGWVLNQFDRS
jgi:hypothetical protein